MNAESSKNNFAKRLYNHLFKKIIDILNNTTAYQTSFSFIAILDIAGFG